MIGCMSVRGCASYAHATDHSQALIGEPLLLVGICCGTISRKIRGMGTSLGGT
jgi:hypothetical protein